MMQKPTLLVILFALICSDMWVCTPMITETTCQYIKALIQKFMDCKGNSMCMHGTVSIISIILHIHDVYSDISILLYAKCL